MMNSAQTHPRRLLVLDDDINVAQTVVNSARSGGAESTWVGTAEEFFAALAQYNPTHVAIDLMMPDLDGISVIRRLAENFSHVSVIIISGASQRVVEAAGRSALEHGLTVSGALVKPFSRQELLAAMAINAVSNTTKETTSNQLSDLETRIVDAVEMGEISIALQPKVAVASGELVGFEVLARWQDADGVVSTPDKFIPAAERAGVMNELTRSVLGQALEWLSTHFPSSDLTIAVNVSASSLRDDSILTMADQLADAYGIPLQRLVLEITESEAVGDHVDTLDAITQLRLRRIGLAIDDFGVGYSSLIQLARLPFSELKIDKRFVSDLTISHESRAIVAAIIGMARGLHLTTVAEGVEDLETFDLLKSLGCDTAQGYFIGRPMSAQQAAIWVDVA